MVSTGFECEGAVGIVNNIVHGVAVNDGASGTHKTVSRNN